MERRLADWQKDPSLYIGKHTRMYPAPTSGCYRYPPVVIIRNHPAPQVASMMPKQEVTWKDLCRKMYGLIKK